MAENTQTATENNVLTRCMMIPLNVNNPRPVLDPNGRSLGSAVVSFVEGGVKLELNLDKNTPEAFDLEMNPRAVKPLVLIFGDSLDLRITVTLDI